MPWSDTYKDLVTQIELTITDVPNTYDYYKNVLNIVVDIINEDSTDIGINASVFLFPRAYRITMWSKWNVITEVPHKRKLFIKDINDLTIREFGDLTNFVNSVDWDDGCVPFNWAEISEELGYDTSDWIVCS